MDLRALVADQLDPTKKNQSPGFAGPDGNTGIAGNMVGAGAQPQVQQPKIDLGAMGEPGGFGGGGGGGQPSIAMTGIGGGGADKAAAAPGLMSDFANPNIGGANSAIGNAAAGIGGAVGGIKPTVADAAAAPPAAGGGYASFNGFDGSKFGKDSKPGSKYTPDAAVYSQAIGSGVDFGRGNMGPLADFYHTKGYPNATAVGDDKIDPDGPGPMAPIDAIRGGDNAKVYQNTTGNPQWEAQYGGGGAGHGGGAMSPHGGGGSMASPLVQGDAMGNVNAALGKLQQPNNLLQQLIAQLGGGA